MSSLEKLLYNVISGQSDANIAFSDLCRLLQHLGFGMRVRGSHHVFSREGIEDRINLQQSDAKAKPYQVKQVRSVILKYGLKVNDDG